MRERGRVCGAIVAVLFMVCDVFFTFPSSLSSAVLTFSPCRYSPPLSPRSSSLTPPHCVCGGDVVCSPLPFPSSIFALPFRFCLPIFCFPHHFVAYCLLPLRGVVGVSVGRSRPRLATGHRAASNSRWRCTAEQSLANTRQRRKESPLFPATSSRARDYQSRTSSAAVSVM